MPRPDWTSVLRPGQPVAVLDVDRTTIGTTSWYHACATPGYLLTPDLARRFRALNGDAFPDRGGRASPYFRQQTLALVAASGQQPWDARRFRDVGRQVAYQLPAYQEAISYLSNFRREHGHDGLVVFLTAGYEPFMAGVVAELMRRYVLSDLPRLVVGSPISFADGVPVELGHFTGADKAEVVADIMAAGGRVELLADDQFHSSAMFDAVHEAGGVAVRVRHVPGASDSPEWMAALATHRPWAAGHARQAMSAGTHGLHEPRAVTAAHPGAFENLPDTDNRIGVGRMAAADHEAAVERWLARCDPAGRDVVRRAFAGTSWRSGPWCYLRAGWFYLQAPPYLFAHAQSGAQTWAEAAEVLPAALATLLSTAAAGLTGWPELARADRLVLIALLDHLRNLSAVALDVTVGAEALAIDELAHLDSVVESSHHLFWSFVLDVPSTLPPLLRDPATWQRLRPPLEAPAAVFRMRELDDPYQLALAALAIIEQMRQAGQWPPVGVLDFASGALDLGAAVTAIGRLVAPTEPAVPAVHVRYSSKAARRGRPDLEAATLDDLCAFMQPGHADQLRSWTTSRQPVLLVDNNVMTFGTLQRAKRLVAGSASGGVVAAVAAVAIDNVVADLTGHPAEPLVDGWERVLDVRPVTDYTTAFSSWGSSVKTRELHDIFARRPVSPPQALGQPSRVTVKICRVHNAADLAAVLHHGATAIGVHAVSALGADYDDSQQRHHPLAVVPAPADLPVPRYEATAIRAMLAQAPAGLDVVLVVERRVTPHELTRIRAELGIAVTARLQLQCRVDEAYLAELRPLVPAGFVCAVGADQDDLSDYCAFLSRTLDPQQDLVLVDWSAHQPDLLTSASSQPVPSTHEQLLDALRPCRVPVLVADDVEPDVLVRRARQLREGGVPVVGIDTRNSVEVPKHEQRYRHLLGPCAPVQALIRKSPARLARLADGLRAFHDGQKGPHMSVIVSVGDLMVDVFGSPGAQVRHPGGKAAIYAAVVAALGGRSVVVGALGADDDAASIRAALEGAGVDCSAVLEVADAPTGADFFEGGEWRMERGANWSFGPAEVAVALQAVADTFDEVAALILSQGLGAEASAAVIEECGRRGWPLVLNLGPEADEPERRIDPSLYPAAEIIIANKREAPFLREDLGLPVPGTQAGDLARALFDATAPRRAFVLLHGVEGGFVVARTEGEPEVLSVGASRADQPGPGVQHRCR